MTAAGTARPDRTSRIYAAAPAVFVFLWSTGFVAAHYATEDAGPLTFLSVRLLFAGTFLWVIAMATSAPPMRAPAVGWAALTGLGMHALYLGGVFVAVAHGLPTGLSALIAGLHPVVTSAMARWTLRESLRPIQWAGVALGLVGVVVVVLDKLHRTGGGVTAFALVAMTISVLGMCGGTLLQRARGAVMPLLRGTAVQLMAAGAALAIAAVLNEHWRIEWTGRTWFALLWSMFVLSIASVLIMLMLLQRQAAAKVSSLFFLTPALSTIEGAILFDEHIGAVVVLGLVVSLAGVYLTTRRVRTTALT